MSRADLRREWKRRIADYRASGQTQKNWCEAHNVTLRQLHYWLKKLKNEKVISSAPQPQWLPIEMNEPPKTGNSLTIKVGSAAIEVAPGYDPQLLIDVVKTLRSVC